MKLTRLELKNFRLFKDTEIIFPDSKSIVIVGNNGSGKTSILDAIAICMTHMTGFLLSNKEGYGIDSWFTEDDITHQQLSGKITSTFNQTIPDKASKFFNIDNSKSITVTKRAGEKNLGFDLVPEGFLKRYKELVRSKDTQTIPIVAFYNTNRTCPNISKRDKFAQSYDEKLSAYQKSLSLHTPSFNYFEEWFIMQVRQENAIKVNNSDLNFELPSLRNVRRAFHLFMSTIEERGAFSELKTSTSTTTNPDFSQISEDFLIVVKGHIELKYKQLSYGERMAISLVCETARRLTIANENEENALEGEGIVLIDELDLHLHPNWQRNIVSALTKAFPNIQFIFSTHSPLILSGMKHENILVLGEDGVNPNQELPNIYSASADEILEKLLHSPSLIQIFDEEKEEINSLFNARKFDEAESKLIELKAKVNASPKWLRDYEQRIAFAK